MALFEFDDGRLIPAQFGRSVPGGLSPEIIATIRDQLLEIIGRPLFAITWADMAPIGSGMDGDAPRLTALDASGQVVSVELMDDLNSRTMIDALSRLGSTASLGWTDLAAAYPGGIDAFRFGWAEFRDAMPPSPAAGPRLILMVTHIDDEVRLALDVLASSGVEVHEISVRSTSSGRVFVEVNTVGQRFYGHRANLLTGSTPVVGQIVGAGDDDGRDRDHGDTRGSGGGATAQPVAEQPAKQSVVATSPTQPTAPAQPTPAWQPVSASRRERRAQQRDDLHRGTSASCREDSTAPVYEHTADSLAMIAEIIGANTPIVWVHGEFDRFYAQLTASGEIHTQSWTSRDPNEAAALVCGSSAVNGWVSWHLGDANGPSLADALDEINREVRREYESGGRPRHGKHGKRGR